MLYRSARELRQSGVWVIRTAPVRPLGGHLQGVSLGREWDGQDDVEDDGIDEEVLVVPPRRIIAEPRSSTEAHDPPEALDMNDLVNKKALSEREICTNYITLAIEQAGWAV